MYVVDLSISFGSKEEGDAFMWRLFQSGLPQKITISSKYDTPARFYEKTSNRKRAHVPEKPKSNSLRHRFLKALHHDETTYDDAKAIWFEKINEDQKSFENAILNLRQGGYLEWIKNENGYAIPKQPIVKTSKANGDFHDQR